jgi:uncharacterized glyoxalase superfamily protein PhnB
MRRAPCLFLLGAVAILSFALPAHSKEMGITAATGLQPATFWVDGFFEMWASGQCDELGRSLSGDFEYVMDAKSPNGREWLVGYKDWGPVSTSSSDDGTTVSFNRSAFLSVLCHGNAHKFLVKPQSGPNHLRSFGHLQASGGIIGGDIHVPISGRGSAPCMAWFASEVFVELEAIGKKVQRVANMLNLDYYRRNAEVCTSGVPTPLPSQVPGKVASGPWSAQLINAFFSGNCKQMINYFARGFKFQDGYNTPVLDANASIAVCYAVVNSMPETMFYDGTISDAPAASISGPSLVVVTDPVTKLKCAVAFQQQATTLTTVEDGLVKLKSMYWIVPADIYDRLWKECHVKA